MYGQDFDGIAKVVLVFRNRKSNHKLKSEFNEFSGFFKSWSQIISY